MSLAERLATDAGPHVPYQSGCTVGRLLAELTDEDRDAVDAALEVSPTTSVARAVNAELGTDVAAQTWARHLRGDCACDKVGLA